MELQERYVPLPDFVGQQRLLNRLRGLFTNDPDDIQVGVVYLCYIAGLERVRARQLGFYL